MLSWRALTTSTFVEDQSILPDFDLSSPLCVKPINFARLGWRWGWTPAGWFQRQCPIVWSHTLNTRLWLTIILKIMIISLIILIIIYDISHHKTSQTRFRRIPAGNCSGRYPRQRPIVWSDSLTHSGKRRQRCQRPRDPLIQWWQHSLYVLY